MSETSPLSPPRTRSSLPAVGISGFFQAVDQALKLHLESEHWPDKLQPVFVHEFPKERIANAQAPFDVVTFHVEGSAMAPTSNNDGRIPKAPFEFNPVQSQQMFGYNTQTLMWWQITNVAFDIYSRSNASADTLTEWFHQFMMLWGFGMKFFRARGVEQFCFLERKPDQIEKNKEGQELYKRTLVYQVRVQYLRTLLQKQFDSVTVTLGVDRETDTFERP